MDISTEAATQLSLIDVLLRDHLDKRIAPCNDKKNEKKEEEAQDAMPDSTTNTEKSVSNPFQCGDDVLVPNKDGRYYLGTIVELSTSNDNDSCDVGAGVARCLVKFGDGTHSWAAVSTLKLLSAPPADDGRIMCVVCKRREGPPPVAPPAANAIIACDMCGRGYHAKCHSPPVDAWITGASWHCKRCVDQRYRVAAAENRASKRSDLFRFKGQQRRQQDLTPPCDTASTTSSTASDQNQDQNGSHCYCGEKSDWLAQMLLCCRCNRWFHQRCVSSLQYPLYAGDKLYIFACLRCNGGSEYLRRLELSWLDLAHLALYNLTAYNAPNYFDLDTVIMPYIMDNWHALQLPEKMWRTPVNERREKILTALQSSRKRFKCGREMKKRATIWGLRFRRPPPPPHQLQALQQIKKGESLSDELVRSHASRLRFLPRAPSPASPPPPPSPPSPAPSEPPERRGSWMRQLKRAATDTGSEGMKKTRNKITNSENNSIFYKNPTEYTSNTSYFKNDTQDKSNIYSYAMQEHSPDPYLPRVSAISPPTVQSCFAILDKNLPQSPKNATSLHCSVNNASVSTLNPENSTPDFPGNISSPNTENTATFSCSEASPLSLNPESLACAVPNESQALPQSYDNIAIPSNSEKKANASPPNPQDNPGNIAYPPCFVNNASPLHPDPANNEFSSASTASASNAGNEAPTFLNGNAPPICPSENNASSLSQNIENNAFPFCSGPVSSLGNDAIPSSSTSLAAPNLEVSTPSNTHILDERTGILHQAFICDICSKKFKHKKSIKKHISKTHKKKIKIITKKDKCENRKNKKKLRAAGKEYKTLKGKVIFSRVRNTFFCRKCPYKCTSFFKHEQMDDLFKTFWSLGEENGDQDQQRQYISSHTDVIEPTRRRVKNNSRKQNTYIYYVTLEEKKIKVCRRFFIHVHGITEKFVRMSLKKRIDGSGLVRPDCRGRQPAKNKTILEDEQFARNHILSIPAVESHYCRQSTTRKYLPAELNLNKLYDMYKDSCKENDRVPISTSVYKKYFYEYNLSFHKPRKDTCNACQLFESLPENEKEEKMEEYQNHLKLKDRAREVKNEAVAKGKENSNYCVLNFDMQAVLECPKGKACAIFYKRKFSTYNLTIYDIISHHGICNMWTEVEGNRGSIEVATCVYKHIQGRIDKNIFYFVSDSCGGQNRNQYFATACLEAVKNLPHVETIDHIFYEPGHSQQEGDSMHSTIERAAKNVTVNAPSEWVTICKISRKNPAPYEVHELHHDDFIDFKEIAKNNPIQKSTAISWLRIKWLRYSKAEPNKIQYRYDYDSDFMTMTVGGKPGLRGRRANQTEFPKAYRERLPITKAKFNDLVSLCKSGAIPRSHHSYYQALPHRLD